MSRNLLLLSSSNLYGTGFLDHAENEIRDHFHMVGRILFIPYALQDYDAYHSIVRERLSKMNYECDSIHLHADPRSAVASAEAIYIGGGNTFRLLNQLYKNDLLKPIRERIDQGVFYLGSSAGSNVACPSIRTTNDMPIVYPPSLDALGLIPFQINPHYLDADPASRHLGETREERIREYHEENDLPVVGLREGTMIRVKDGEYRLKGIASARIFCKGMSPVEIAPGNLLNTAIFPETTR